MTLRSALLTFSAFALVWPAFADHRENERNWMPRFRGMDRDGDGAVSAREWRGDRQSFRNHDWNGDGRISGDELRQESATSMDRGSADRQVRDSRFRDLDTNGDGVIQSTEWKGSRDQFHRLDRDGNSRVTYNEFTERRHTSNTGGTSSEFSHLDKNRNGVIDGPEWTGDRQAFHAMDVNGNSVLDYNEYVDNDSRGNADRGEDDSYFNRRRR